jgi:hypothetical protein
MEKTVHSSPWNCVARLLVVASLTVASLRSALASDAADRPDSVDLRPELRLFGLTPRAQGARGTCSIFTTCEAIEFALAARRGHGERLSPEFLNWSASQAAGRRSDGNFFHNAIAGFERFGLCTESAMPYRARLEDAPPSDDVLAAAARVRDESHTSLAIHWIVPWQPNRFGLDDAQFGEVLATLARGFPVAAGSGHSRLLVGYRVDAKQPGGGRFLTEDSALAAFSEVTFDFVRKQVADVFWVEATPPLASSRDLPLADHGRSDVQIVVPRERTAALEASARELAKWLATITGATLPVVAEDSAKRDDTKSGASKSDDTKAGAPTLARPTIQFGPTAKALASGLVDEARALGEDGVLLRSIGGDLVLLGGGERGQRYVVYELLERFLDCRFLTRDCSVAPKRETLVLPPIDRRYAPPFAYREVLAFELSDGELAARLRLNGGNTNQCVGRQNGAGEVVPGVVICPFVHSAESMVPSSKYAATHPEYFGLVNGARHAAPIGGQLCYTNPDVLKLCTEWVDDWFTKHPEITIVDVSQNDASPGASGACECEQCAAIVREDGSQHGPILRFVNALAAAVAKNHPGRQLETLAYQHTLPAPKVTKPRDDVVIRLCQHACYFHGIDCLSFGAEYRQALADWRRVAKHVDVWHYGVNFWSYLAPNPNLAALASDLKRYARDGVDGVMVQCDLQSPGELSDLRAYLCAQLTWDPTRDPLAVRRDFCAGCFGPASDDVLEFLSQMDRWGAAAPQHIPMNGWNPPGVTPPDFVSSGLATLEKGLAKTTDPAQRNRVEKLLLPLWYMQLAWPDKYGLAKKDGAALLARFERVLDANGITTLSEGAPNAGAFLGQMRKVYGDVGAGGK